MEVSYNQIIDIGLNLIGSLSFGGLLLLLFGRHRYKPLLGAVEPETAPAPKTEGRPAVPAEKNRIQFIDFSTQPAPSQSSETGRINISSQTNRRNRLDTIGLARDMLNAGTPHERIKQVLPISDGELALMSQVPQR
ncbi:MAG: hypothetical protein SGI97_10975 [candidate division Zixibacteria bacterium]|nr:hypothetical protein [candidate division Zixibacteria bacterium]